MYHDVLILSWCVRPNIILWIPSRFQKLFSHFRVKSLSHSLRYTSLKPSNQRENAYLSIQTWTRLGSLYVTSTSYTIFLNSKTQKDIKNHLNFCIEKKKKTFFSTQRNKAFSPCLACSYILYHNYYCIKTNRKESNFNHSFFSTL